MSVYKTKQGDLIEDVLRENSGHHTADEIYELLRRRDSGVGRTTVYRRLERLTEEGLVRRYSATAGECACYEYVDEKCTGSHFHLKCTECGRLIHLKCELLDEISEHIGTEHGFKIDPMKTVYYGVCDKCAK